MKVVLVETDAQGGLVHFAFQLGEALAARGSDVQLVTGHDYELATLPHRATPVPILRFWPRVEPAPRSALEARLRRLRHSVRRVWRGVVTAREWERLTRYLLRERPDVAVFSIIRFPFQALYLRRLRRAGIRCVQICHEFVAREIDGGAVQRARLALTRSVYESFAAIAFLSEATRAEFAAAYPDLAPRTHVLPHGPELLFEPTPEDRAATAARYALAPGERVVLMVGGLRPSKGVPDLVDAFGRMDRPRCTRLIVAGYPSVEFDTDALARQVAASPARDAISLDLRYLGMGELGALVHASAVVVFPYRSATASGVLALAQSLARPVVATAVGGLAEAVEPGLTGLLVPPGDPDALARALEVMLADPEAAAAMGARGHEAATGARSWDAVAARLEPLLAPQAP
jgi:glycosyltransferase involved in cell wall biosynthesis